MSKADNIDCMVSFCTKTQTNFVAKLTSKLEASRIRVWNCLKIKAGEKWVDLIAQNVEDAEIFLLVIDEAWANSPECMQEFMFARQLNLQSQNVKPVLLPLLFEFDFKKFAHLKMMFASLQFMEASKFKNEDEFIKEVTKTTLSHLISLNQRKEIFVPELKKLNAVATKPELKPLHKVPIDEDNLAKVIHKLDESKHVKQVVDVMENDNAIKVSTLKTEELIARTEHMKEMQKTNKGGTDVNLSKHVEQQVNTIKGNNTLDL